MIIRQLRVPGNSLTAFLVFVLTTIFYVFTLPPSPEGVERSCFTRSILASCYAAFSLAVSHTF